MPVTKKDSTPVPVKLVVCPGCGGESVYASSNPFRPFCSERCKNIDLGAWASEDFRLPADAPPDDEAFGDPKLQ
ncbi:MAG: DNA gyrase inhibitor YacG [Polaromonas sp.]|nr:DNA gyrase inhibitor YacG [Polaromonas sp.]